MTSAIMLAVLFAAALHATWNALAKSGGDPLIETTLILLGGSAFAVLLLPVLAWPAAASWPYIAASTALQVVYFALVAAAYRSGDMSLAYPLMRGAAPLLVTLVDGLVLGERLSPLAIAGIVLTCGGVLSMARVRALADRKTIGFALANALVIASYTLVDGIGARRSGQPFSYTLAIFLASCIAFVPFVAWRHPRPLLAALRLRWPRSLAGGACIVSSYAIALWAMTGTAIAPIAALREFSIVFGLILARLVLDEHLGTARIAGGLLIVAGAVALRVG